MLAGNNRRIRILQVVGGMNRAGIETWLMRILRKIDRDRFAMDFVVHTNKPCAYDEEAKDLGSRIIPCLSPKAPWAYSRNFAKILNDYGPYDIVHSQVYLFSGFVLRLAEKYGVPVRIAHMHPFRDFHDFRPGRALYRRIMTSWISLYATCILAPSESSLKSFMSCCNCNGKRIGIIHNCLELDDFNKCVDIPSVRDRYGLPQNKPVVIYVARFYPHKNHEQIIRVANIINARNYCVHFVMAGSHGNMLNSIRNKTAGRQDISVLVGLENVSELMMASDLFFFPSLEEGFGIVAIEAAAAGLPIVATNLPSIQEACPTKHHEYMFPPNDDKSAAGNIMAILSNSALRNELSHDARKWATQFSTDRSADELISVYKDCLKLK